MTTNPNDLLKGVSVVYNQKKHKLFVNNGNAIRHDTIPKYLHNCYLSINESWQCLFLSSLLTRLLLMDFNTAVKTQRDRLCIAGIETNGSSLGGYFLLLLTTHRSVILLRCAHFVFIRCSKWACFEITTARSVAGWRKMEDADEERASSYTRSKCRSFNWGTWAPNFCKMRCLNSWSVVVVVVICRASWTMTIFSIS